MTPPVVHRAPLEVVRAFQFNQDDNWSESRWAQYWTSRQRRIFDQRTQFRTSSLRLRTELLKVLNVANEVNNLYIL